jgi:hypothetical protein
MPGILINPMRDSLIEVFIDAGTGIYNNRLVPEDERTIPNPICTAW